jgi:2-polyprenyl-3-methyl-5-hydroxy-6-metoxy-1,4-benzoquinol methylase
MPGSPLSTRDERYSDGVAWNWEGQAEGSDFYDGLVGAVTRHVPRGSRVLEIGVGAGYLMSRLSHSHACSSYGIDLLDSAMHAAARTASQMEATLILVRGSGFALPFAPASFDVVGSYGVIEHYDSQRAREMLEEHARVCRPGGLVLVSTPNALDLFHGARRALLGRRYPFHPERSYTPWGLARELREVGLLPIGADGYAPLWGLRQSRVAYPVTALLHKAGVLAALGRSSSGRLLSLLGNLTLQVARKPA